MPQSPPAAKLSRNRTRRAARRVLPGKECHRAAWCSRTVAVVKMVGPRIVEIYGLLDCTEPEDVRVEVHILLRGPRNGGDVMDARNTERHVLTSAEEFL